MCRLVWAMRMRAILANDLVGEGKGGEGVDLSTESGNDAFAHVRDGRVVTHFFASKNVAYVHFNDGEVNCSDGIGDSQRCVSVCSGVEHNAKIVVGIEAYAMELVDDGALVIALKYSMVALPSTAF